MSDAVDARGLVRLALKLVGLGLVIYALVMLATYAPMTVLGIFAEDMAPNWLMMTSPPLMILLFGVFLWLFPSPVTNTLFRAAEGRQDKTPDWAAKLEVIGVALLGLWLLFRALSDLVYHLVTLRARAQAVSYGMEYSEFGAYFVATLVELAFALFLLFGARGIVRLLHQVRYGGLGSEK